MNVEAVLTALLAAAILTSVTPMLAAVGEAVSEQSGLLNLGIEGVLAIAAFSAFWVTLETDSHALGLLTSMTVGIGCGVAFGVFATTGGANQVVLGLGMTLAGTGASAFLFRTVFGSDQPLLSGGPGRPFAGWGDWLPVMGPALFDQRWFVHVAWVIVVTMHLMMRHSLFGLRVRAAGELPIGLEAVGGNVTTTRIVAA
ncbi:MAG TPA: hypothetical protein VD767_06165, partial [Thermomicrobiales bacterium]|nr:hypothetical protein [Thermomicrobiales bacterium]